MIVMVIEVMVELSGIKFIITLQLVLIDRESLRDYSKIKIQIILLIIKFKL